jgi:S-adenosylmethionine/arginine decarboxylase-like enzyme
MSQLLIDCKVKNSLKLNNENYLCDFLDLIVDKLKMTVLHRYCHQFDPCGVTIAYVLAESHICLHTFPEKRTVSIDVYSCKKYDYETFNDVLVSCIIKLGIDEFLLYKYVKRNNE